MKSLVQCFPDRKGLLYNPYIPAYREKELAGAGSVSSMICTERYRLIESINQYVSVRDKQSGE